MSILPNRTTRLNPLRLFLFWALMIVLATVLWKMKPKAGELLLDVAVFLISSIALFLWRKMKQHHHNSSNSDPIYPPDRPIG